MSTRTDYQPWKVSTNQRQKPNVGKSEGEQAGKKFFNDHNLQQAFSKMSQPKAVLSPREENQWTALQIAFNTISTRTVLPDNIDRAAMLRLKEMGILSDTSNAEANISTAYFTKDGIRYVLNLTNDLQRQLANIFSHQSPSYPQCNDNPDQSWTKDHTLG